jgi:peptide chain release factor 3
VGTLQLDVLKSRLQAEYGLDADLEASPYDTARWIAGTPDEIEKFTAVHRGQMAQDRDGAPVFLAKSTWELGYVADKFPAISFAKTRERADVHAET